jgi:hypothetical protein
VTWPSIPLGAKILVVAIKYYLQLLRPKDEKLSTAIDFGQAIEHSSIFHLMNITPSNLVEQIGRK